jgi:DNA polymerase-3 subunit gamma/tau
MLEYVQQLCTEEGVEVAPGVLPLVVRAGGGSPRDTLSLLDQLIAGSDGPTIDYERAVALLGYTHGALLDEVVDAIGAGDAAGAFAAADRVVQTGQDPRRFVEDLLERLRDLIVVAASSPETAAAVLRGVPEDELVRMAVQAAAFGQAELSRVADLVNQTLTEMTGATSPRLHLELMLARVLVPAADDTERGALVRVERLERRVGVAGAAGAGGATSGALPASDARPDRAEPVASAARIPAERAVTPVPVTAAPTTPARPAADSTATAAPVGSEASPISEAVPAAKAETTAPTEPAAPSPAKPVGPVTLQQMRDAWPEVLSSLQRTKRSAWMVAFTAQVRDFRDGDVLVLAFPSEHDVAGFRGGAPGQSVSELLRGAIVDVLGVRVKFVARVDGAGGAPAGGSPAGIPPGPAAPQAPEAPQESVAPSMPSAGPSAGATSGPVKGAVETSAARPPASETRSAQSSSSSASSSSGSSSSASSSSASSSSGSSSSASSSAVPSPVPSGPVDSWATVAIPRDPVENDGAESTMSAGRTATALAERPEPAPTDAPAPSTARAVTPAAAPRVDLDTPPDDADAPPEDEEPPFDPGPEPEVIVEASASTAAAASPSAPAARAGRAPERTARPVSSTAGGDGFQRYGEAVVREVLGATFLEEVEAPQRPGFGERG